MKLTLPTDSNERKEYSLSRGCYAYFPAALAGVARHSFKAGAKHTKGELIHIRNLSSDTDDCIERHAMDIRDIEAAINRAPSAQRMREYVPLLLAEANALAWRALEWSQRLHERYDGAPLAPAARLDPPTPPEPAPKHHTGKLNPPRMPRCRELGPFSGAQCVLDEGHPDNCNFIGREKD